MYMLLDVCILYIEEDSQLLGHSSVGESDHHVGQVPPVCAGGNWDVAHAGSHQRVHVLAHVVVEDGLQHLASDLHEDTTHTHGDTTASVIYCTSI